MQNVEQETLVEKNVAPLFLQIYPNFNKIKIIKKSGHFEKKKWTKMSATILNFVLNCFFLFFFVAEKRRNQNSRNLGEKCLEIVVFVQSDPTFF